MKKTIIISFLALLLVVGTAYALTMDIDELMVFIDKQQPVDECMEECSGLGGMGTGPQNVIGTKIASTTTVVNFIGTTATTTYPTYIGRDIDTAIYTIGAENATSTDGYAYFSILSSDDNQCWTSSTSYSSAFNNILKGEIFWADASDHILNASATIAFDNATGTIAWVDIGEANHRKTRQIILTNLNSQCLALEVKASSTDLWATISTKQR